MAVTPGTNFFELTATADAVPLSPVKVTNIAMRCPTASAGGLTTLQANGVTFFSKIIYPDEFTQISFNGQWMGTLTASAVGTGVVVTVYYA